MPKRTTRSFFSVRLRISLDAEITSRAKSGGLSYPHSVYVCRVPRS